MKQRLSKLAAVRPSTGRWSSTLRNALILVLIAVIVATIVVMTLWNGNAQYRPLYGEHEQYDQTQVVPVLEQSGIDYYIDSQLGQILVARDQVGEARMALAGAGVKPKTPIGLEILTTDSSLGTSQFIENARYRHGLEGELARSIMALDSIANVRVHLAIPKQTLFVRRDKEQPSASVIVSLFPGKQLQPQQVKAITNLVSGSVTGLLSSHVNIIDQHGNLLSSDSPYASNQGNSTYLDYLDSLEQTYIDRATKMLQPMMGVANFRVEVAADINFDQMEATEETFGQDGVVRSEFSSFDRKVGKDAAGVPGALSNLPPESEEDGNGENAQNSRGENSRDYLIDRTIKQIKYQQGALQRLSVSVLLNGEDGAYSAQQVENLKAMLTNALGLNVERGDALTLTVFPFSNENVAPLDSEPNWWQQPFWFEYLQYVLTTIVAIVVLLVVVRPLIRQIVNPSVLATDSTRIEAKPNKIETISGANPEEVISIDDSSTSMEHKESNVEKSVISPIVGNEQLLAELPSSETGLEAQTAYLQMLSEKEPERVAHVVKQWISQKNADN